MRKLAVLLLILLVALLAAGCGGDDDEAAGGDTAAAATEAETAAAADECATDQLELVSAGKLTIGTDNPAYPPWFGGDGDGPVEDQRPGVRRGLRERGRLRRRRGARLRPTPR